jgi:nitroimidazol reductase NimA-like FMN-containing flavoprotein (pyridoxamine 5'-phosphate oxidase superfamily)
VTRLPDPTAGDAEAFARSPLSEVRRNPEAARYDRDSVYAILDAALYCHVGFIVDGRPVVIPTIHDRVGDLLYLHGSRSNRMLRHMTGPAGACVAATVFDGLVLARSVFNHTMHYRSVVAFGHPELVEDPGERGAALDHLVDHVLPGRSAEARPPNERELSRTAVVRMAIEEASAKVDDEPPPDDPADLDLPVWAGHVPARTAWGQPVVDRRGAWADQVPPLAPSVRRLLGLDGPPVW